MSPSSCRSRARRRRPLLVLGALIVVGLLLGVPTAQQLRLARREMRAAKTELDRAWIALQGYRSTEAEQALGRAQSQLDAARDRSGFPLTFGQPLPLLGSPVKALLAGQRAAAETLAAGRILIEGVRDFPTEVGEDHDLGVIHGAAVRSRDIVAGARGHLEAARHALEGPAGAAVAGIANRARKMIRDLVDAEADLEAAVGGLGLMAAHSAPDVDARLLVVALDSTELRPAGGDIGSYGILHFHQGKVDLEHYGAALDRFRDAPLGPDFPTAAAEVREMFRRGGGPDVDGVLAITDRFMAGLVGALREVRVPGHPEPVRGAGFAERVVREIAAEEQGTEPKKFLVDLSQEVFRRLSELPPDRLPDVFEAVNRSVASGDLKIWFARPQWQAAIAGTAWDGALPDPSGDFLMVTEANLTDSRANLFVKRSADYRVVERPDGRLAAHLKVTYRNEGPPSDINPHYNAEIRAYVPQGAELATGGVAPDAPDGPYAVLRGNVLVAPGDSQSIVFDYVLPTPVRDGSDYHLTWRRQTGTGGDPLTVTVGDQQFHADPAERDLEVAARLG